MSIQVLLFGSLADVVGKSVVFVDDCKDTQSLKDKLTKEYPPLNNCAFLISVDRKLIKKNQPIELGNEIALLPPYAGG